MKENNRKRVRSRRNNRKDTKNRNKYMYLIKVAHFAPLLQGRFCRLQKWEVKTTRLGL